MLIYILLISVWSVLDIDELLHISRCNTLLYIHSVAYLHISSTESCTTLGDNVPEWFGTERPVLFVDWLYVQ